jgi:hypothetical protein
MYKYAHYVGIILLAGLTLAAGTAIFAQQSDVYVDPSRKVSSILDYFDMKPGFQAFRSAKSGTWHWQYGKTMENSCQTLAYAQNPVELDGIEHFIIHLSTTNLVDSCRSVRVMFLRGNVNASSTAKFTVTVDDKTILP